MSRIDSHSNLESVDAGRPGRSVLVVAHADDEILFFSSIIDRVDAVVICYMGNPRYPERRAARMRVLADYPLDHVETLDIATSAASRFVDWDAAAESAYGLAIPEASAAKAYRKTYEQVVDGLSEKLSAFQTVYTHNPWGEYGHADHVPVYRAVAALARDRDFRHLFSNYVAPKSIKLALPYLLETGYAESISYRTNIALAHAVRDLYIREDCWTVPDNFSWPAFECFNAISRPEAGETQSASALLFPLNFIPWRHRTDQRPGFARTLSKQLRRIKNLTRGATVAN